MKWAIFLPEDFFLFFFLVPEHFIKGQVSPYMKSIHNQSPVKYKDPRLEKSLKQKLTYILQSALLWESLLEVKMLSDLAFQALSSTFLKFQMKGQSQPYYANSIP